MYPGNSPGKSYARMVAYSYALKKLGKRRFNTMKHIVIASVECGDIRYLVEHGVPPKNIIACDVDWSARSSASMWDVIVSNSSSIEDTVLEYQNNIATVNVDLCAALTKGGSVLGNVLDNRPPGSIVFYTYFRARDGMYSQEQRTSYLTRIAGKKPVRQLQYQSSTYNSGGSPMCMAIL